MSAQIWTTDQMNQMMIAETQPPDHKDAQQLKTIKRRFNWIYLLLALLGIIVIVLLILLIVLFAFYNSDRNKAKSADELSYADQAFIESRHMWQNEHCKKTCTKKFDVAPLILLSLDGFNAGYLTRNLTPSLKIIAECGAHAPFMYGSYPTKTFPNHYAIATGLYPESHGVVDNNMFDPTVKNDTKFVKTNTNPAWWFGEPIWNTVMKNGKKAACFYWPGSEVPVQGLLPTYKMAYNKSMPFSRRVDQAMEWLDLPEEKRPALITIYMDQPDTAGHEFGPDSDGVNQALIYVDSMINYLMTSLYQRDLMDCVNLMIVADHGMQQLYEDKRIFLDQYFDVKGMRIFSAAVGRIMLENSTLSAPQVVDKMKCLNGTNFRVYEPKNIPKRLHYAKSYRIGDVIIDSAPGSMVFPDKKSAEDDWDEQGDHGFDFRTPSMHAIFFGHGPGFKEGVSIQPFQNIELYNLMADLMQLPSRAPTNGTKGALYHILSNPPPDVETSMKSLSSCVKKLIYGFCGDQCAQSDDRPVCQPDEVISLPEELATSLCSIALCNSTTIYDKSLYKPKFTQGIVVAQSKIADRSLDCKITVDSIDEELCDVPDAASTITTLRTPTALQSVVSKVTKVALYPFGNGDDHYFLSQQVGVYEDFANGAWKNMQELTLQYARHFGRLIVISGVIYDYDHDGLADGLDAIRILGSNMSNRNLSTHIYQIIIRCDAAWVKDNSCQNTTMANVLSFVLPNQPNDINCLPANDYLLQNTARVRDIELLTGLEFFSDRKIWPRDEAMRLRTHVNQELWQLVPTVKDQ